jgi:hypothetical protein
MYVGTFYHRFQSFLRRATKPKSGRVFYYEEKSNDIYLWASPLFITLEGLSKIRKLAFTQLDYARFLIATLIKSDSYARSLPLASAVVVRAGS